MSISLRQILISMGIACLISAPISRGAMVSQGYYQTIELHKADEEIRTVEWTEILVRDEEKLENNTPSVVQGELVKESQKILDEYGVEVPEDIQKMCEEAQDEFNVCAELLEAIGFRESRYKAKAENGGCSGIMQISTKWHKGRMKKLGVKDIYEPQGNIRVAADYLAELFEKYDGDLYKVLMTYNGDSSKGVSAYAIEIAEISEALERVHGK